VFDAESRDAIDVGRVTVLVRPERVAISNESTASSTPVTVTSAIFLGEILRMEAQMDGGDTLLILRTDTARRPMPAIGDRLHVSWGSDDCWVLT
jgi:putative spermidine/putrescine transport system ATP-binding protein